MPSSQKESPATGPRKTPLLASNELMEALREMAGEASSTKGDRDAEAAFGAWQQTASAATGADSDWTTFASEAAFAAAARAALEARVFAPGVHLEQAFPHLYGSPLFSWFRTSDEDALRAALSRETATSPTELLGWIYQFAIPEEVRKRFGHFYTQPSIVDSMLDSIGFSGPAVLGKRLIDPAVGAGAFVIGATKRVILAAEEEGQTGAAVWHSVQSVIHGLDLNPLGILLSEAAIGMMLADHLEQASGVPLAPLHLYVTDSLRQGELTAEAHALEAEEIKSRTGAYANGFEYVIANPPYAKWPSRLLSAEQKRRFSATTYGHPNLYGLFLQVGVELLANGGRMAFINPKSFVSGLYFKKLRSFLIAKLDIQRFDTFGRRTGLFDGVLQDVVIMIGERRAERVDAIEIREFVGAPDQPPAKQVSVARSSVLLGDRFDNAFFVDADELTHQLLARMTEETVPLEDLGIKVATGTVVWNRLKGHMRDAKGQKALPLIWGNGIRSYRFLRLGNREGGATHALLDDRTEGIVSKGQALLVKRMTAKEEARRLVACRVPDQYAGSDDGYFAENHVNLVFAAPDAQIDLDTVLGLLNSRLYDYVFRALNGNTQVSATELAMLPVKMGPQLQAIAAHARKLTAVDGADPKATARIDELIAELFGLTKAEESKLYERYEALTA